MLAALLGLLQQSPPSAETSLDRHIRNRLRYESLLGPDKPGRSLLERQKNTAESLRNLGNPNVAPKPRMKPAPNPLQDAAALVANEDRVPIDFIINEVIDPIAYHESNRTMDPAIKQQGGGPGRGMFQFEGKRGVKVPVKDANGKDKKDKDGNVIMGDDSLDVALRRASRFYKNKNMKTPYWIENIKEGQDATSLTGDQQKALAILNFKGMGSKPNKVKASFKSLYNEFQKGNKGKYNNILGEFWKTYHHRKAGEESKTKTFMGNLDHYNSARFGTAY